MTSARTIRSLVRMHIKSDGFNHAAELFSNAILVEVARIANARRVDWQDVVVIFGERARLRIALGFDSPLSMTGSTELDAWADGIAQGASWAHPLGYLDHDADVFVAEVARRMQATASSFESPAMFLSMLDAATTARRSA